MVEQKLEFIRTPIPMFQIVTGGGVRFSTIVELWGANRAGKSSTCYQSAANFLSDYGEASHLLILDSESSIDWVRMKETFYLDCFNDPRISVEPASFLEEGFHKILQKIDSLEDNKYLMIIWDTLSTSPAKSTFLSCNNAKDASELSMYVGGISDRPRITKHYLRQVMSKIYGKKVSIWLPNQVFSSIGSYGPTEIRGEGSALQHDIHYSLYFQRKEVNYAKSTSIATHTISYVSVVKSKFCPEFSKTPLYIDNTRGGIIDEATSLVLLAYEQGYIIGESGWYKCRDEKEAKGVRWDTLVSDETIQKKIAKTIIEKVRSDYAVVDKLYLLQGFPPLQKVSYREHQDITEYSKKLFESVKNDDVSSINIGQHDTMSEEENILVSLGKKTKYSHMGSLEKKRGRPTTKKV